MKKSILSDIYALAWKDWLDFVEKFNMYKHLDFNEFKRKFNGEDNDVIYTIFFKSLQIGVSPLFDTANSLKSKDESYFVSCHVIIIDKNRLLIDHLNYPELRNKIQQFSNKTQKGTQGKPIPKVPKILYYKLHIFTNS